MQHGRHLPLRRYCENKAVVRSRNRTEFERSSSDQFSNDPGRRTHESDTDIPTVVSRSVQAVNYKHRGGATKLELLLHCGPQMGCFNANKKSLNANKIRENR